ncbi:uncharacterized protein METZ01_LOCUS146983 [marine metagenome]|uniref:Uncharacterized protein n=1 Tax=marine metagenome TaxID=408172 RepID=A0A381ZYB0_9ZZZZ
MVQRVYNLMELDQQKPLRPDHNWSCPANQHIHQHSPGMGDRADCYKQQNFLRIEGFAS